MPDDSDFLKALESGGTLEFNQALIDAYVTRSLTGKAPDCESGLMRVRPPSCQLAYPLESSPMIESFFGLVYYLLQGAVVWLIFQRWFMGQRIYDIGVAIVGIRASLESYGNEIMQLAEKVGTVKNMSTEMSMHHETMRKTHENIRTDIRELLERTNDLHDAVTRLKRSVRSNKLDLAELMIPKRTWREYLLSFYRK